MDLAAFVMAGGKSSRMGSNKAFLDFGGRTLLAHMLDMAASVASTVRVVGSAQTFASFAEVVEDLVPGHGPLGGIDAALACTSCELNLMLAVDLPFVQVDFLRYLVDRARTATAIVSVARTAGRLHPLCGVYRPSFRDRARTALAAGQNKIIPLLYPIDTLVIEESELARLSFPATMFDNLNTPDEYAQAQAHLGQRCR